MTEQETIISICEKAIALPECPLKKKYAIASRIWLKLQIEKLLSDERPRNRNIQGVAEDAVKQSD